MAQYLNTCFMISTIDDEYLVKIEKGIVTNVQEGPFVMPKLYIQINSLKGGVVQIFTNYSSSLGHTTLLPCLEEKF